MKAPHEKLNITSLLPTALASYAALNEKFIDMDLSEIIDLQTLWNNGMQAPNKNARNAFNWRLVLISCLGL